ncbi:MAG: type VI secretion system baseplate subunit TssK [Burkholderiales bacterium]|nr:MAG: type VI secretion system baseplate subunit TssK [Burkholderiales bacterium]
MWRNKVVWSEGLFLRPQHFQQQERHFEYAIDRRARSSSGYGWGFERLELDPASLGVGKLQINAARGVLPDGTLFAFPEHDPPPAALDIPGACKDELVFLALPVARAGVASTALEAPAPDSLSRFRASVADVADSNEGFDEAAPTQLAMMNLRLLTAAQRTGAFSCLAVARIIERKADGQVVLDPNFVPTFLGCNETQALRGYIAELLGLLRQRVDALAARITEPGRGGVAEIADFLLLQTTSRHAEVFDHLSNAARVHPERLYERCRELAGELAAFGPDKRITVSFPAYDHDDLYATFKPVMELLRLQLSMVLEQTAIQIPLQEKQYGVRLAIIADRELLRGAAFVLAVNAQLPAEAVRLRFPTQVKLAPPEKLRDFVNRQLPGIPLRALPVAPRQIPYHAGFSYFELDTHHPLWRELERSGGLAMHVAGEFPGLELEFWAIRG